MANINDINNKLSSIVGTAGFGEVVSATTKVASNVKALEATSLGEQLNENISGVQGLTAGAGAANIAILQSNLTGLGDQVIKDVSTNKDALQAITGAGDTIENGFLDFCFASPSAEGVKAALNVVATPSASQTEGILKNIVPEQFSAQVSDIVDQDFSAFTNTLTESVSSFTNTFSNLLNGKTGNILQDVLLQTDTSPLNAITSLGLTVDVSTDMLLLLQTNKLAEAVTTILDTSKLGGLSTELVENALSSVPTKMSQQIDKGGVKPTSLPIFDPTTNFNNWKGAKTPVSYFSTVATFEELVIELINTSREITEVVFYGYMIGEDQSITPSDIHDACNSVAIDGIAYHYVVMPNGDLRRGRSLAVDGDTQFDHDEYSIAIVVPHKKNTSASAGQSKTVDMFLEAFWNLWPGGQCWDTQEIDISSYPVGVNIDNYRSNYRKQNFGNAGRSYSTAQLISAAKAQL